VLKTINVVFEDEEFKKLLEVKDGLDWRTFILKIAGVKP
jgi:hypothetical protein